MTEKEFELELKLLESNKDIIRYLELKRKISASKDNVLAIKETRSDDLLCKHPLWVVYNQNGDNFRSKCIKCNLVIEEEASFFAKYIFGPDNITDNSQIVNLFDEVQMKFNNNDSIEEICKKYTKKTQ